MKKFLSIVLCISFLLSISIPGLTFAFAAKGTADAYATVFTASDFQTGDEQTYQNLISAIDHAKADGITQVPDGFIFGGDYTADSLAPAQQVPLVTNTVLKAYPNYDTSKMVYVQGNHDAAAPNVLTPSGLHEFEHYYVFSINEDDFKTGQATRTNYAEKVQTGSNTLRTRLQQIYSSGDRRPVFVATHLPLHHNSRNNYGDNLYSKYIFDVLNEFGTKMDIIFLFGHNHSGTYDDYIGGSVNFLEKGETIRIPIPDVNSQGADGYTEEILNFTYTNYGYMGYSNNTMAEDGSSTNALTMSAFELCNDKIVLSRYSPIEKYSTETISRVNVPSVNILHGGKSLVGEITTIYAVYEGKTYDLDGIKYNFSENAVGQWYSSNSDVATISQDGIVTFTGIEGNVSITYSVTEPDSDVEAFETVDFIVSFREEPTRYFKPTTTIESGKNYIVVSKNEVGAAYMMSGAHRSGNKSLAAEYAVINPDTSDDTVYIEVPSSKARSIWVAEAAEVDGTFHFINFVDGMYLYADFASETISSHTNGVMETYNHDYYMWKTTNSGYGLENLAPLSDGNATGVYASTGRYYRHARADETSNVYIFEETKLEPVIHIRSHYVDVEGTTIIRQDVCRLQTETLETNAANFPANKQIDYVWSVDNTSVATVDSTGVITYTGNPGTVTVTVTGTSRVSDDDGNYPSDTASVTFVVKEEIFNVSGNYIFTDTFIPGKKYIFSNSNAAGDAYVMTGEKKMSTDHYRLALTDAQVNTMADGKLYIPNENPGVVWECIESGTDGYYYFKNAQTLEYLTIVFDRSYSPHRRVTTTPTLNEYSENSYLITKAKTDSSKRFVFSAESVAQGNYLLCFPSEGAFRSTATYTETYIYQSDENSSNPYARIKLNDFMGPEDITDHLQSRYGINENDTEQLLCFTKDIQTVSSVAWSVDDRAIASVSDDGLLTYTGRSGMLNVDLTVTGLTASGEEVTVTATTTFNVSHDDYKTSTEDYPDYPHEGSVRINKIATGQAGGHNFQTTGVTEVELSLTGVPMPQAVDVVIVFDHSSSMNSNDKLKNAIEDTKQFALQIVNSNEKNRVALVTFDRYRDNYQSFGSKEPNYTTNSNSKEDCIVSGDGTPEGAFVDIDHSEELIASIENLQVNDTAGTNYDFGLSQCYKILEAAKKDHKSNKNQYVVFMSDGEPYAFNRLVVNISESNEMTTELRDAWCLGDETNTELQTYLNDPDTYPVAEYFNPDGENWYAEAIKFKDGATLSNMPNVDYYEGYNVGLGATVFTIGYDTGAAGSTSAKILTKMASSADKFYYAQSDLQEAYDSILENFIFAARDAVVTDVMGENFSMQFAPSVSLGNGMNTLNLEPAPYIEVGLWDLQSDGTREEYTPVETITFETNANGNLIAAYSNLLTGNIYNVATSTIHGANVEYNLINETFIWNVGNITESKATLKYYAYLEGSAEGDREGGVYDTNEYAEISYINYLGNYCYQTFPVPALGWGQAAVNYEFYYVNQRGEPVNKQGFVVPFEQRTLVGNEITQTILLNSEINFSSYSLIASQVLPDGYVLYNPNAQYHIAVSSGDNPSQAMIVDEGKEVVTTYFRDGTFTYNENGQIPDVIDYTNTHVSFAVVLTDGLIPDTVVIDYGIPVKISVLANDVGMYGGKLNAISDVIEEGTELHSAAHRVSHLVAPVSGVGELKLANGKASIDGDKIVYTPTNTTMSTENVLYYEYLTETGEYYYTTVTVIPATNIYYEDSFMTFNSNEDYEWVKVGTTIKDVFQAEDRPGIFSFSDCDANNVYGRDAAYYESATYSMGSAYYTTVDENSTGKEPTAEFDFCGTGFDLFSVTSNDTGAVNILVYDSTGKRVKNLVVQTYYGYSYSEDEGNFVPDTENGGCLYQVPIIKVRDLAYGTYSVVVKPRYNKMFDMKYDANAENSYDIYVDAVRIYNPAGTPEEGSVIKEAYYDDGEFAPEYLELREHVLTCETFYSDAITNAGYGQGSIFIDGASSLDEASISDKFLNAGPNNEVYIAQGQAVAFHVRSDTELTLASLQLGMKTVHGKNANVGMLHGNSKSARMITVEGAHETYRRLNTAIVWDQDELANGVYQTKYPIIIVNTSDAIVSLTQFKWAYTRPPAEGDTGLQLTVTEDTPQMATTAAYMAYALANDEPDDSTTEDSFEDVTIEWSETTITQGTKATLVITTPLNVVGVKVGDNQVMECEIDENGFKRWTYSFTVNNTGENSYEIVLCDNNGNESQPVETQSITVEEDPQFEYKQTIIAVTNAIIEFLRSIINYVWGMFI